LTEIARTARLQGHSQGSDNQGRSDASKNAQQMSKKINAEIILRSSL
jgi:hypothetical protein